MTTIKVTKGSCGNDNGATTYMPLKIDLNNFEDPQYEDSKYVLSSPRSLEACSRLSVKPVDLLYKPLAEFQEELLPQDVPLRTIYNIYDEHEQLRIRKLQLCREERYRIIATQPRQIYDSAKSKKNTARFNTGGSLDKGSLQRRRTAWATSVGHKRVTCKDIDDRANELHHESLKLKQELLSRKEGRPKKNKPARSRSASRNTSAVSIPQSTRSNRSVRYSISIRTPRSKVNTTMTSVKIPETDRKIVELMKSKREEERKLNAQRVKARRAWADERQEEERIRDEAETRRRLLLAEENRIKHMKEQEKERRQKKIEEEMRKEKEVSVLDMSQHWDDRYIRQLQMKDRLLDEKREKDKLRKSMQELNLKQSETEREAMERLVQQSLQQEIESAEKRKEMRAHAERMKKMVENLKERESFEKRRDQVEITDREEKDYLRSSVDLRHTSARSNYEKMLKQKYHEIKLNQRKRASRQDLARQSHEMMDAEMENWRQSLVQKRKAMEREASRSVERQMKQLTLKLQEERKGREKTHKINIRKVHKELQRYEKGLRSDIELKDKKSQLIQEQKDASISQTRAVAEASQRLRDEVRWKYDNETIADKALQAEMYARMGFGVVSAVKNTSSLQFG